MGQEEHGWGEGDKEAREELKCSPIVLPGELESVASAQVKVNEEPEEPWTTQGGHKNDLAAQGQAPE